MSERERAELHQRIMNLRADKAGLQPSPLRLAYRDGHRDARHAAAELVAALPVVGDTDDYYATMSTEHRPSTDPGAAPVDVIVGHKTVSTGRVGPFGFPEVRHEPLTRAEADALIAESERTMEQRAANMPNEQTALAVFFDAWQRLKELGWRDAIYCPKDGTIFDAIEAGSTGIHDCSYQGEWPRGGWWIHADGDLCPSYPVLFRLKPEPVSPAAEER